MPLTSPWNQPSRASAKQLLESFLSHVGDYARVRNYDESGHRGVSRLSPYLRCRLVSEEEVVQAVQSRYEPRRVEKFLQEIVWRTYWKGWLEMRPEVWSDYLQSLSANMDGNDYSAEMLRQAYGGRTGIDCFDHWVSELLETGYLHNHARMWFASIWIFTLKLPWELGADFFYRHLLDGDPASNTLSWRWVAGLQTRGKHYLARAENIQKYTHGRFYPKGQLNEEAEPLVEEKDFVRKPLPAAAAWPQADGVRRGLLLLGEDCSVEATALREIPFATVLGWSPRAILSAFNLAEKPLAFHQAALEDALVRAGEIWQCPSELLNSGEPLGEIARLAESRQLEEILYLEPPVGPWRSAIDRLKVNRPNLPLRPLRRPWDQSLWPHASAGFFRFKKKVLTVDGVNF